jgi:hypothetical protein
MAILTKDGLKSLLDQNVRGDATYKKSAFATNQDLVDMITTPAYHPVNASNAVTLTEDATIGMTSHGFHPIIVTGTTVVTLPAVTLGHSYWIINGNPSGTGLLTISPNASDRFLFDAAGATGTEDKDLINTQATAKRGDYVKLVYGSADGWVISEMHGTWIDEA